MEVLTFNRSRLELKNKEATLENNYSYSHSKNHAKQLENNKLCKL